MNKSYSELQKLKTFKERFDYLSLNGNVGEPTFGSHRYLNQKFYHSPEWRRARREVIKRDQGLDLGCKDHEISGHIYVHHINPISAKDIESRSKILFDPENLISTSYMTSQAIHYGDFSLIEGSKFQERKPNDTKLW